MLAVSRIDNWLMLAKWWCPALGADLLTPPECTTEGLLPFLPTRLST